MTLHTLNQAPANRSCLDSCLNALRAGDTLLLIEDGTFWALPALQAGLKLPASVRLCALAPDLQARGIQSEVEQVDDAGFVELCVQHDKVVSWF